MNTPVYVNPGNYGANPFDVLQKYIDTQLRIVRGQINKVAQTSSGITLTTNGTSGTATLVSGALNIPVYSAGVTSFNSRTGAVIPAANDYSFAQLASTPTTLAGYGISDGVSATSTTTFTNKTFDTAGTGNSFLIAGTAITANTGTGSNVLATSPTLTTSATLNAPGIGITGGDSNSFLLTNTTAATSGLLQYSPPLAFNANAWNTTSVASVPMAFRLLLAPLSSSTNQANFLGQFSTNGGAYATSFFVNQAGNLNATTLSATTSLTTPLINKVTITQPATSATLTLAQGSTLATSGANSITFTSTGSTNVTLPTSGTLLTANQTITLTGNVTGSGTTAITTTIPAATITLAMHANQAATSVIGNNTGSAAAPSAINVPMTVASGTVSAAATLDINISAYYNLFSIIEVQLISLVPATDNVQLSMRVSTDGTTYDSSASTYAWAYNYSNVTGPITGGSDSGADTQIMITGGSTGSASGRSVSGIIKVFNTGSSALNPLVNFQTSRIDSSGGFAFITGGGARLANQVTKGVRFLFSSGNITSGIWRIIGYV